MQLCLYLTLKAIFVIRLNSGVVTTLRGGRGLYPPPPPHTHTYTHPTPLPSPPCSTIFSALNIIDGQRRVVVFYDV